VSVQGVTPDLAASLGLGQVKGALVSNVVHDSPADRAGIKAGDVIVGYEGKPINNASDLPSLVAGTPVGKTVSLQVMRGNKATPLTVAIGKMKDEEVIASTTEKSELGLTVEEITPDIAEDLGLEHTRGVVITDVVPDGLGEDAGFQLGDIVREINRQPVRNLSDYKKIMASAPRGKSILFLVQREDSPIFLALRKEE
jgi:serine protease Do